MVYLVASLTRDGKLSVSKSNSTLSLGEFSSALSQTREYDRILIKIREKIASDLLSTAKDILKNAFSRNTITTNEDEIISELKDAIGDEKQVISSLLGRYATHSTYKYPGEDAVNSADEILRELIQIKDNTELFNTINDRSSAIISAMQALAPVKEFFESTQARIFDDAVNVMNEYKTQSLTYTIDGDEPDQINEILTNPEPYRSISNLPSLTTSLKRKLDEITERRRKALEEQEKKRREEEEARKKAAASGTDTPTNLPKKRTIRPGDLTAPIKTHTIKSEQDVDALLSELKTYLMEQLSNNDELEVF